MRHQKFRPALVSAGAVILLMLTSGAATAGTASLGGGHPASQQAAPSTAQRAAAQAAHAQAQAARQAARTQRQTDRKAQQAQRQAVKAAAAAAKQAAKAAAAAAKQAAKGTPAPVAAPGPISPLGGSSSTVGSSRPLAIYYGWPSSVNGAKGDVQKAVAAFAGYGIVVFGDGNVMPGGDTNAKTILAGVTAEGGTPYGYVTVGVTDGEPNYSVAAIEGYINAWHALGAQGMFLDCAGADYGVSRARFDAVVTYAHSLGMNVMANAWNPADVLSGSTTMGPGDSYLGENDVLNDGKLLSAKTYAPKLAAMAAYKKALGISLYETGTTKSFGNAGQLTAQVEQILAPYGISSFQLTDPMYSSRNNVLVAPAHD